MRGVEFRLQLVEKGMAEAQRGIHLREVASSWIMDR
jgi:hypothetical protein